MEATDQVAADNSANIRVFAGVAAIPVALTSIIANAITAALCVDESDGNVVVGSPRDRMCETFGGYGAWAPIVLAVSTVMVLAALVLRRQGGTRAKAVLLGLLMALVPFGIPLAVSAAPTR
ncbi:MAG TPA: hypothetical protein VFK52_08875 [Nocardioidaceae bacterium]|nr:hypothetical protein [Nocardioidaceae bacterium]